MRRIEFIKEDLSTQIKEFEHTGPNILHQFPLKIANQLAVLIQHFHSPLCRLVGMRVSGKIIFVTFYKNHTTKIHKKLLSRTPNKNNSIQERRSDWIPQHFLRYLQPTNGLSVTVFSSYSPPDYSPQPHWSFHRPMLRVPGESREVKPLTKSDPVWWTGSTGRSSRKRVSAPL